MSMPMELVSTYFYVDLYRIGMEAINMFEASLIKQSFAYLLKDYT